MTECLERADRAAAAASPAASFEVDAPTSGNELRVEASTALTRTTAGGAVVLCIEPGPGHYAEDIWNVYCPNIDALPDAPLTLEADYIDKGYGVIAAERLDDPAFNARYAPADAAASHTRLNTGRLRRAAFRFDARPAGGRGDHAHFRITGLQYLRAIRVRGGTPPAYWDAVRGGIPAPEDVQPAVHASRPMQIVTSAAGALSGTEPFGPDTVAKLRESLPLAKALGFNGIESYVRWNYVEPEEGRFDWSIYDTVVDEIERHGLKWFPLLIVGSAYTLPDWFRGSEEDIGFVCVEHGRSNPIQSIWSPWHRRHVVRFLNAFGEHYESRGCLLGIRLGPSGNYGESQYPAGGNWGFHGNPMHIHIGLWAGDRHARENFRQFAEQRYGSIEALNEAWTTQYKTLTEVRPVLADQCVSKRQRHDLFTWYTDSMSDWCEWWAVEARKAMPHTPVYQSAGGWGAAEIGTDYSAQTKSMLKIDGGIRLTNELDSFHQAYYATRLCATAARCYRVPLGFEPAMGHTARGVAGRLFNCVTNGGAHFFTYYPNVCGQQKAIASWLKHYCLFDIEYEPLVEAALYYPQTMNFLSSDTFRYLNAWGFNPYAREIRNQLEVDYLDDRLIDEGFLDRYKALVFAWGDYIEARTLEVIDQWLRAGGTIVFPYFLNMTLRTLEDDDTVFRRWMRGDTGAGVFHRFRGDDEPPDLYAAFVRKTLMNLPTLSPAVRAAFEYERPARVFLSVNAKGGALALNFSDDPAVIRHPAKGDTTLGPYEIVQIPALDEGGGLK